MHLLCAPGDTQESSNGTTINEFKGVLDRTIEGAPKNTITSTYKYI